MNYNVVDIANSTYQCIEVGSMPWYVEYVKCFYHPSYIQYNILLISEYLFFLVFFSFLLYYLIKHFYQFFWKIYDILVLNKKQNEKIKSNIDKV